MGDRYRVVSPDTYRLEYRRYKQPTWWDRLWGRNEAKYVWEPVIVANKEYIEMVLRNWGVEAEWKV